MAPWLTGLRCVMHPTIFTIKVYMVGEDRRGWWRSSAVDPGGILEGRDKCRF